jgi:DNA modification methylase
LTTNISSEPEVKNSTRNKLEACDRKFHDWYRFVLSYPPHLVRDYIEDFGLTSDDLLLDPFSGTGTTILEAKIQGIPSIGIEANPVAHFAGSVKTSWDVDIDQLKKITEKVRTEVTKTFKREGISDQPSEENLAFGNLKGFNEEQANVILTDSISPLPLHKCLTLLQSINKHKKTPFYQYLALALANAAVYEFSNLRFGPEVGVGKIKVDYAVLESWYSQISKMISDLESKVGMESVRANIILNDAREVGSLLAPNSISAVITSPPYPNEKDYTRTTRLESVLLGFINNKKELQTFKRGLLRSNTRGVYKGDTDDLYVANFPEIQKIASDIELRRLELGKDSGFEKLYHTVTKLYFGGMAKHLTELKKVLKPGAQLAYVVGDQASFLRVMIRTGHLLGEIAESLGYELVRIDLFRTRFSTATKSDLNEEVVILRWPG